MVWNAFRTEEPAAIGCYQQVVLDTNATEISIGVQKIEIDEILAVAIGLPLVDECRNEIDTRFVGHHESRL